MIVSEVVRKYGKYRPVTRVGAVDKAPLENFSPPWKNVLDIV